MMRLSCMILLIGLCIPFVTIRALAESNESKEVKESIEKKSVSKGYVHQWKKFPPIKGKNLRTQSPITFGDTKGRVSVVIFIASWCTPCQKLMESFLDLERRYQNIDADFLYVFAHDTIPDAQGFAKEYGLKKSIIADFELLKTYHHPELPTVYIGDRHGWLATRYQKTDKKDVDEVEELLRWLTAL